MSYPKKETVGSSSWRTVCLVWLKSVISWEELQNMGDRSLEAVTSCRAQCPCDSNCQVWHLALIRSFFSPSQIWVWPVFLFWHWGWDEKEISNSFPWQSLLRTKEGRQSSVSAIHLHLPVHDFFPQFQVFSSWLSRITPDLRSCFSTNSGISWLSSCLDLFSGIWLSSGVALV